MDPHIYHIISHPPLLGTQQLTSNEQPPGDRQSVGGQTTMDAVRSRAPGTPSGSKAVAPTSHGSSAVGPKPSLHQSYLCARV